MRRRMIWTLWWVLLPVIVSAGPTPTQHRLTVTFDYDFTTNHGCKKKDAGRCVAQFNIYEITDAAKPVKLFLIYAPRGAKKAVKGIKGTSGLIRVDPGTHSFGVTALMIDGAESSPQECMATVTVGTGTEVSLNFVGK